MSVRVHISDKEIAKLGTRLDAWARDARRRLQQAAFRTAHDVRAQAVANANQPDDDVDHPWSTGGIPSRPQPPYRDQTSLSPHTRTGTLKSSINVAPGGLVDQYEVRADAAYAPFVEFGTARSRPHPFMFPAAESKRRTWEKRVRKAMKEARP